MEGVEDFLDDLLLLFLSSKHIQQLNNEITIEAIIENKTAKPKTSQRTTMYKNMESPKEEILELIIIEPDLDPTLVRKSKEQAFVRFPLVTLSNGCVN